MPNRVIKESIRTSPNLNKLSDAGEVLFYRLLTLADDHGCFEATPDVLRGNLFLKKFKSWPLSKIIINLVDLANNDLIRLWVQDDRLWGFFINMQKHNRIRSLHIRKTPEPKTEFDIIEVTDFLNLFAVTRCQLTASCRHLPANDGLKHKHKPNPKPNPKHNPNHNPIEEFVKDVNVFEKNKAEKKDVDNLDKKTINGIYKKHIQFIKLSFLNKFKKTPYPFIQNDKSRETFYNEYDGEIEKLVNMTSGDIDCFINDMENINGESPPNSIIYFLKSQHGASRWEKLAIQFRNDEHKKLKQEWANALESDENLRALTEATKEKEQPEWVKKEVSRYNEMVKKYNLLEAGPQKDNLRREILIFRERYGV